MSRTSHTSTVLDDGQRLPPVPLSTRGNSPSLPSTSFSCAPCTSGPNAAPVFLSITFPAVAGRRLLSSVQFVFLWSLHNMTECGSCPPFSSFSCRPCTTAGPALSHCPSTAPRIAPGPAPSLAAPPSPCTRPRPRPCPEPDPHLTPGTARIPTPDPAPAC